jgi:hypothetical protein
MPMSNEKPLLPKLAGDMEYFARQVVEAKDDYMKQVHYSDHLQTTWWAIKDEIELILKTGEVSTIEDRPTFADSGESDRPGAILSEANNRLREEDHPERKAKPDFRFRDLTLVEGAVILLTENGKLHGREIERRLKSGGYQSDAKFFQNMLDSTFKRDGRFKNVGGNTWELKNPTLFHNGITNVHGVEESKE